MKLPFWFLGITVTVCHLSVSAAISDPILERSLQAQQSYHTLSGRFRTMFTNFALDDDTPASDYSGRFTVARTQPQGRVDRVFSREHNDLKAEPLDSISSYVDGQLLTYIMPDGTGKTDKAEEIQGTAIMNILRLMETGTRRMIDSTGTRQLPDTVIDGRKCYLFTWQSIMPDGGIWDTLAIESKSLLPVWHGSRNRSTERIIFDQRRVGELKELQIDIPFVATLFDAPPFRTAQQAAQGSCNEGESAPKWTDLPDAATGRLYSLDSLLTAGNVVVMDWSTSTCGSCVAALPIIDSVYRHYRSAEAKVTFVMMNHGDSKKQAQGLIERKGIDYPVLLCPASVADAYGLYAYPVFLVVDRTGKIVYNHKGGRDTLYRGLVEAIDSAVKSYE